MKRLTIWIFVLAVVFVSFTIASAQTFSFKTDPVVQYEGYMASSSTALVSFEPNMTLPQVAKRVAAVGFNVESFSTIEGIAYKPEELLPLKGFKARDLTYTLVKFNDIDIEDAIQILRTMPGVTEAYPNYVHEILMTPNDPGWTVYQGDFRQIYVDKAWDISNGQNAVVAVIDTGFRKTGMQDLPEYILPGYDFYYNDTNPNDFIGHGTHVSNTIAERTNNSKGVAGIAYKAKIMPLKVFPDYNGGAYDSDIIDAINYAVSNGAKVINMSLGGGGYSGQTNTAINNAFNNEVLPFAASGNSGAGTVEYPAAYANCVAVGSVKRHNVGANPVRSSFSNYGTALDLVAPGENILQETFNSSFTVGYYLFSGTSMATPHAAAVAALLVAHGGADASRIRDVMYATAHNPAGAGKWTNTLGWGEVDAYKALQNY